MIRDRGEEGQTLVETALVLPMMIFFILGIIQLALMQQAHMMTEYAAYRAARAGIVNHGDCKRMKDAAFVSLLPTLGEPRLKPPNLQGLPVPKGRVDTFLNALAMYKAYTEIPLNNDYGVPGVSLPKVRAEVVNPSRSEIDSLFGNNTFSIQRQELDFDDTRQRVRDANLLSVRITYFYQLRIPFANWLIHSWYMGMDVLRLSRGVQFDVQTIGGQRAFTTLENRGLMKGGDFRMMAMLAQAPKPLRKYVVPLEATYSMRMQSNMARNNSGTDIRTCAVDP